MRSATALTLSGLLAAAVPAAAAPPEAPAPAAGRPSGPAAPGPLAPIGAPLSRVIDGLPGRPALGFTIAGGVSLGAYEAGQLHYLVEVLKQNPALGELKLVTGASAGSTNGLMSALALCATDPRPLQPEEGLFWRTWIPLGIGRLWSPARDGGAQGAFSREWMDRTADALEAAFDAGLREDCDVVLGVSVTRVVPRLVRTPAEGLELPRIEEKFAVRLRGRGPGRPPSLTNHTSTASRWAQHLLPEGPDGQVSFTSLRELVFASTAFPLAFPPQALRHCVVTSRDGEVPRCPPEAVRTDLFVDGGLLDNSPLRLAVRLATAGLREDGQGGTRWLDAGGSERGEPPPRALFAYVTPDAAAYPAGEELRRVDATTPLLVLTSQLAGAFVATARAKNLSALMEEYPGVADRIVVPLRHYPAASSPMAAFFGFFEQRLREFDFELGMYDARRMVVGSVLPAVRRHDPAFKLRLPDDLSASEAWRPLECLRAVLGERSGAAEVCQGAALTDFRILAQASLFRLWDGCTISDGASLRSTEHPHCRAAMEGRPPLLVPGVAGAEQVAWRREPGEGEAAHAVRLLSALGFRWKDLGLDRDEGDEALPRMRQLIGEVSAALSGHQPGEDRFVTSKLVGLAANTITYVPPRTLGWVTLGRQLELGASHGLGLHRLDAVRLHAALQLHGVLSAFSSDRTQVAPALLLGLEVRPRTLASGTWQPAAILRMGAVLTPRDGWGTGHCDEALRDTGACTRPAVQAGLAVSVLESARVQVMGEWYPRGAGGQRALWAVAPSLGLQVAF